MPSSAESDSCFRSLHKARRLDLNALSANDFVAVPCGARVVGIKANMGWPVCRQAGRKGGGSSGLGDCLCLA